MLQSVHVLHNNCGSGPCAFWMLQNRKGYLAEQSSGRFCRMGNVGQRGRGLVGSEMVCAEHSGARFLYVLNIQACQMSLGRLQFQWMPGFLDRRRLCLLLVLGTGPKS